MIFGYSSDVPVIKDQSQVATVVVPYNPSMGVYYRIIEIDGVKIGMNKKKSPFRVHGNILRITVVDLLPGSHTITITYEENFWVDEKKGKYTKLAPKMYFELPLNCKAGCVYQIKALVENSDSKFTLTGFTLSDEVTDPSIIKSIENTRNDAKF